ncbi:MAG TPA: hypothetical protein VFE65_28055 [Pseudonocardia sp.]|nr:hypothetical protein [Pseudonocardia sp.]
MVNDRHAEVPPGQLLIDLVADDPPRLVVAGEIDMDTSESFAERLIRRPVSTGRSSSICARRVSWTARVY